MKKNYRFKRGSSEVIVQHKIGKPPGSLVYVGKDTGVAPAVSIIQYRESDIWEFKADNIEQIEENLKPGYNTWINVDGVHDAGLIDAIGKMFSIDHLTLEDIMNTTSRPKFEEFDEYIYVVLKDLHIPSPGKFALEQISVVITKQLIISFQEEAGDVFDNVRNRLRTGTGNTRHKGTDYIAYSLIDAIVDNFIVISETFDEYLENLEDELYQSTSTKQLTQIKEAKQQFNILKRTVQPMKELVFNMYRSDHPLINEQTHLYIRDLSDHTSLIHDLLDQSREKVYGLMGIYQSGTNNIMNNIMKTLTVISTVFMASSLVAGIYGMNFDFFQPGMHTKLGFYWVLGGMVCITIILVIYFKIKKWL